jgi:hypothetical protein
MYCRINYPMLGLGVYDAPSEVIRVDDSSHRARGLKRYVLFLASEAKRCPP